MLNGGRNKDGSSLGFVHTASYRRYEIHRIQEEDNPLCLQTANLPAVVASNLARSTRITAGHVSDYPCLHLRQLGE